MFVDKNGTIPESLEEAAQWLRQIVDKINNASNTTATALFNYHYTNKNANINTYINGQANNSVASLKLGISEVKDVGCESVAIHNAMIATYDVHNFRDVLYKCESIKLAGGLLGCNPYEIGQVLHAFNHEYNATMNTDNINNIISYGRVFIISFWNADKWADRLDINGKNPGLHTVAFRKNDDGTYTAWNVYNSQANAKYYDTFDDLKEATYRKNNNFIVLYSLVEEA